MSRYADIIERLEKAEGPDRDLDRLIAMETGGVNIIEADNYTASLDAAVGLVERVLPEGWDWQVHKREADCFGYVGDRSYSTSGYAIAYNSTPPLAILLALFHALQSQENSSE